MPYNDEVTAAVQAVEFELGQDDKKCDYDDVMDKDCAQHSGEWYDIACCEKQEHREYEVYVPVSVTPYVHVSRPEARCVGEMKIERGCKPCCKDDCKEFEFTLTQKLSVDVPVKYGVVVHYHKPCAEDEK